VLLLDLGSRFFRTTVPQSLVAETFSASRDFFKSTLETKLKFAWNDPAENSGYVRVGHEGLDEDSEEGDPKESYDMNKQHMLSSPIWQNSVMTRYWRALNQLKEKIVQCYAAALDVPLDFFQANHDEEWNTLRLLHYLPVKEGKAVEYRVGPHSDYGTITLLIQDSVGGLQVFDRTLGKWKDAISPPGTVVVNTADLLMRWTNDRFPSTMHRVVGPMCSEVHAAAAKKDRYSIAYFVNPNQGHVVENVMRNESPKYEAITALDYLVQRLSATYSEPEDSPKV